MNVIKITFTNSGVLVLVMYSRSGAAEVTMTRVKPLVSATSDRGMNK